MTILDLAKTVNKLLGDPSELVIEADKRGEGDPQRRRPDITRAQEVLDWNPTINLEDGLGKTLPYFQDNI